MTKKTKFPATLNAKMLYTILLAALCAVLVFAAIKHVGGFILGRSYMSEQSVEARKASIYSQFNTFVSSQQISSKDTDIIARWSAGHRYTTLYIFKEGGVVLLVNEGQYEVQMNTEEAIREHSGKIYPVRFNDGVYQIAIQEESQLKEYALNDALSLFGAIMTFLVIILAYMRRLTLRIIDLSHEAVEIGAGDLEHEISVKGRDEISILASEVDHMRRSVIERMSNERKAWQANSDLITAISHDIRTPMTTMIGYLELLSAGDFEDKEHCRQFTAAAYDKAMALKDLTDELFKYFLVFGKSELEMDMEHYEAGFLLGQLLAEAEFDLTDAGFTVSRIDFEGSCSIVTDPLYLKRVFDNLVSNIKKYADRERPVMFITELKDAELSVCFSNYISQKRERVESTKIGVRTCEKIMTHMNGSFTILADDIHFSAEFRLPASGIVELLGVESEE